MSTFEMIKVERDGPLAIITLNRPDRLNAAPPHMFDEIKAAAMLAADDGARALLITGEGRAFCSGADLAANASSDLPPSERTRLSLTEHYNPAMLALAELPIPIVNAVNGVAAGIGCSLALAADFVVAAESAYFLLAFVNIGLVPDGGASWWIPRSIGTARANEMMMLGERIPAEKAEQWGLIYKSVPDAALMEEARALAMRLANGPTIALGGMRRLIRRGLDMNYGDAMTAEADAQSIASGSADAMEGIAAFLGKRPASFTGK